MGTQLSPSSSRRMDEKLGILSQSFKKSKNHSINFQTLYGFLPLAVIGVSFFSCPGSSFDAMTGKPVKDDTHRNIGYRRAKVVSF